MLVIVTWAHDIICCQFAACGRDDGPGFAIIFGGGRGVGHIAAGVRYGGGSWLVMGGWGRGIIS